MNPRVKSVKYESPYKLILGFDNNETREFDLVPYLQYQVYKKLTDERVCSSVSVFNGTVIWDDDTDFDPDTLYLESKMLTSA